MIVGNFAAVDQPDVLLAISPYYAINFMLEHRQVGLITLGLVFLAVTGGDFFQIPTGRVVEVGTQVEV
jgi:KUP system potassium uptake protein